MATLTAVGVPNTFIVVSKDQDGWLTFDVGSFEDYEAMPAVVECEGKLYSKKGWNSDHMRVYYKPGTECAAKEIK